MSGTLAAMLIRRYGTHVRLFGRHANKHSVTNAQTAAFIVLAQPGEPLDVLCRDRLTPIHTNLDECTPHVQLGRSGIEKKSRSTETEPFKALHETWHSSHVNDNDVAPAPSISLYSRGAPSHTLRYCFPRHPLIAPLKNPKIEKMSFSVERCVESDGSGWWITDKLAAWLRLPSDGTLPRLITRKFLHAIQHRFMCDQLIHPPRCRVIKTCSECVNEI